MRSLQIAFCQSGLRAAGSHIAQLDDPVGVIRVDGSIEVERCGADDRHIFGHGHADIFNGIPLVRQIQRLLQEAVRVRLISFRSKSQSFPSAQIALHPLGSRQRPFRLIAPLVDALDEHANGRLVHDAGVDSLKPMIVPADDELRILAPGPFFRSEGFDHEFLGRLNALIDIPECAGAVGHLADDVTPEF